MKCLRLVCLFALILAAARAAEPLALQTGERLTYRVAWGVFGNAGEINISATTEINDGKPNTVVSTTTQTRGVLKRFFRFEARAESIFDPATGRLTALTETSVSKKKKTNIAVTFDYDTRTARFSDYVEPSKNVTLPIPPGPNPTDLIMSLVGTRLWDLAPGDKRDTNVIFDDEFYELTVHALGYEEIETPLGRFRTLKLEPRMEKTPPKGMFRRGSKVHVWIAQGDERRLPVRFEVEFKFGVGISTLVDYVPPTGPTAVLRE